MKAIPCPISDHELRTLVEVDKLTDKEIASQLPGGTVRRVQSWRKRFGIEAQTRWSRQVVSPIQGKLLSLLIGSMLGDGRLSCPSRHTTRYQENHADNQLDYLKWKVAQWGSWARPIKPVVWTTDGKDYPGHRFHTVSHPYLNEWQALFYDSRGPGGKRLIPRVVDLVDEFALAIWYLDDGSVGWWPDITFGMDDPSREVAWTIFEKFGLQPRWQLKSRTTGEFHMEREDTAHCFLRLIRPHVPKCMAYKLTGFGFMGKQYTIRQKIDPEVLREMAQAEVPIRVIARRLGVGASTVSRWLKKLKIQHPRRRGRPSLLDD